jgi:hypothetical protein
MAVFYITRSDLGPGRRDRLLSAMKRHSPTPSLGRSDVGSTQQAAIQFARMNVAPSAIAAVRHWIVIRPLEASYRSLTMRSVRMSAYGLGRRTLNRKIASVR